MNAIAAAVGDEVFRRSPVTADMILTALENGGKRDARASHGAYLGIGYLGLWALGSGDRAPSPDAQSQIQGAHMAVIRDMMPVFELFQPASD